jgi:hypothetical protein
LILRVLPSRDRQGVVSFSTNRHARATRYLL